MLLHIDSKQEVKWATVLFPPDIDDIIYCSAVISNISELDNCHCYTENDLSSAKGYPWQNP